LSWAVVDAFMIVLLVPYLLVPLYRVVNPISTLMLWRWASGARVERSFVPIERMAPALPMTVIASEDGRFCIHRGIDWREIRERLEEVDDISAARGVSTITHQTAKNLLLWPGRSFLRKAGDLPLALWTDFVLPKRRAPSPRLPPRISPSGRGEAACAKPWSFRSPYGSISCCLNAVCSKSISISQSGARAVNSAPRPAAATPSANRRARSRRATRRCS